MGHCRAARDAESPQKEKSLCTPELQAPFDRHLAHHSDEEEQEEKEQAFLRMEECPECNQPTFCSRHSCTKCEKSVHNDCGHTAAQVGDREMTLCSPCNDRRPTTEMAPCGGCSQPTAGRHKCCDCCSHMHTFCGVPLGENEGSGVSALCLPCNEKRKNPPDAPAVDQTRRSPRRQGRKHIIHCGRKMRGTMVHRHRQPTPMMKAQRNNLSE